MLAPTQQIMDAAYRRWALAIGGSTGKPLLVLAVGIEQHTDAAGGGGRFRGRI